MAVSIYGQLAIQATAPGEDPIKVGSLWVDTSGVATLKVCTSVAPYTFSAISGGGALADLSDVALVAAAEGDYLRFNGTDWVDVPASQLATDLEGLISSGGDTFLVTQVFS
jgi:hypothetical protein